MRISSMLGATMVAGAPDSSPAGSEGRPSESRSARSSAASSERRDRHGERRARHAWNAGLRRRLLQR